MDFVIFSGQKITISMGNALFIGIWVEIENVRYDSESKCIFETEGQMRRILRFHSETFLLLVLVLSLCGVLSEIIYLLDRGRKRKEPLQEPRRRSKRLKAKQDQDEEEPIEPNEVAER